MAGHSIKVTICWMMSFIYLTQFGFALPFAKYSDATPTFYSAEKLSPREGRPSRNIYVEIGDTDLNSALSQQNTRLFLSGGQLSLGEIFSPIASSSLSSYHNLNTMDTNDTPGSYPPLGLGVMNNLPISSLPFLDSDSGAVASSFNSKEKVDEDKFLEKFGDGFGVGMTLLNESPTFVLPYYSMDGSEGQGQGQEGQEPQEGEELAGKVVAEKVTPYLPLWGSNETKPNQKLTSKPKDEDDKDEVEVGRTMHMKIPVSGLHDTILSDNKNFNDGGLSKVNTKDDTISSENDESSVEFSESSSMEETTKKEFETTPKKVEEKVEKDSEEDKTELESEETFSDEFVTGSSNLKNISNNPARTPILQKSSTFSSTETEEEESGEDESDENNDKLVTPIKIKDFSEFESMEDLEYESEEDSEEEIETSTKSTIKMTATTKSATKAKGSIAKKTGSVKVLKDDEDENVALSPDYPTNKPISLEVEDDDEVDVNGPLIRAKDLLGQLGRAVSKSKKKTKATTTSRSDPKSKERLRNKATIFDNGADSGESDEDSPSDIVPKPEIDYKNPAQASTSSSATTRRPTSTRRTTPKTKEKPSVVEIGEDSDESDEDSPNDTIPKPKIDYEYPSLSKSITTSLPGSKNKVKPTKNAAVFDTDSSIGRSDEDSSTDIIPKPETDSKYPTFFPISKIKNKSTTKPMVVDMGVGTSDSAEDSPNGIKSKPETDYKDISPHPTPSRRPNAKSKDKLTIVRIGKGFSDSDEDTSPDIITKSEDDSFEDPTLEPSSPHSHVVVVVVNDKRSTNKMAGSAKRSANKMAGSAKRSANKMPRSANPREDDISPESSSDSKESDSKEELFSSTEEEEDESQEVISPSKTKYGYASGSKVS